MWLHVPNASERAERSDANAEPEKASVPTGRFLGVIASSSFHCQGTRKSGSYAGLWGEILDATFVQ